MGVHGGVRGQRAGSPDGGHQGRPGAYQEGEGDASGEGAAGGANQSAIRKEMIFCLVSLLVLRIPYFFLRNDLCSKSLLSLSSLILLLVFWFLDFALVSDLQSIFHLGETG